MELPICTTSMTDREKREPNRDNPSTAIEDPTRAKLLRDTDAPTL
jgi:hypothetical protein